MLGHLAHTHVVDHALAQRRASASPCVHGSAPVDERGGLPRSSTSQNQQRHEPPRPIRSGYRASGLVPRPFAVFGERQLPCYTVRTARPPCACAGGVSIASAKEACMATFVVVHGAWSAAWASKKMRSLLRERGHELFTPTHTGLGERSHLARPEIGAQRMKS